VSPLLGWARDIMRVANATGARAVAIESVRGAFWHGAQVYRQLRDDFGWRSMQWLFVNAHDHGLAQWRPRLFVVYANEAFVPEWTPRPPVRVLDAIASAPADDPISPKSIHTVPGVPREDVLRCVPAIKPGCRLHQTSDEDLAAASSQVVVDGVRRAKFSVYELRRLHPDQPCLVVYGEARYVHPTEDRLLTLRELMRLQGYPDDFSFEDERQLSALKMLGKSVCPPVGEWLAGEVAAHLRGERDVRYVREAIHVCTDESRKTAIV
jgi:DNA (cytosine-5)-methyltransferase 1